MSHRIQFDAIPWSDFQPGARSKTWTSRGKQVRILELTKDFIEQEWCEKNHILYVLAGELELTFSQGDTERFTEGDLAVINSGDKHKPRALSPVVRLLLLEEIEQ